MLSVKELRKQYESQTGRDVSAVEAFVDAFHGGDYHEPEYPERIIAEALSPDHIERMALVAIYGLVRGTLNYRDDCDGLRSIMKFHDTLSSWIRGNLRSPEELTNSMSEVRRIIILESAESSPLMAETFHAFRVVEIAVRMNMRLSILEVMDEYSSAFGALAAKNR